LLHHLLVTQSKGAQHQVESCLWIRLCIQHPIHGMHGILHHSTAVACASSMECLFTFAKHPADWWQTDEHVDTTQVPDKSSG